MFKCCRSHESYDYGWRPMVGALCVSALAAMVAAAISWITDESHAEVMMMAASVFSTMLAPAWVGFAARGRSSCHRSMDEAEANL